VHDVDLVRVRCSPESAAGGLFFRPKLVDQAVHVDSGVMSEGAAVGRHE
jgi:hypothetical protein